VSVNDISSFSYFGLAKLMIFSYIAFQLFVVYYQTYMGLPANRTTSSKRDMRRSHHALSTSHLGKCSKCGNPVLGHRACHNCGFYRGKEAVDVLVKLDKKERKKREKELAKQEQKQGQQQEREKQEDEK